MEYRIRTVQGGRPLPGLAIIDFENEHAVAPFTGQLSLYSLSTRELIKSIKFDGFDFNDLVDIKQDSAEKYIIWCFKSNGEVLVLNLNQKLDPVIKKFELNSNILKLIKFNLNEIIFVSGKISSKPHTKKIISFNLETSKSETLLSIKDVSNFTISNDENYIAFLNNFKSSTIFDLTDNSSTVINHKLNIKQLNQITSFAISNSKILAIGLNFGLIHVFENNSNRLLKWHVDRVSSLSFTNDSNYLLSGGLEKVLVFWQLNSDKQQFLPRLNGSILNINLKNDGFINLTLKIDENNEILILNSIDLKSKLLINGSKQLFNSELFNYNKLLKSLSTSTENTYKFKYDFTSISKIHPISKQVYFLNKNYLQIFDTFKQEQVSILKISNSIPIGKVKSELKLNDPVLKDFVFTKDGNWLVTLEEFFHGEIDNLLSKNDFTYTLKFWKYNDENNWDLVTKIVNPHGDGIPVISLISAPESFNKSHGVLTSDNHGGLRLWKTNKLNNKVIWSLKKLKNSTGIKTNFINLAWSNDSSLIFQSINSNILIIDFNSFEEIENALLTHISGSNTKKIEIINNYLIILTNLNLKSINLLTLKESNLNLKINNFNKNNLFAINENLNLISIVQNFYDFESKKIISKIFIFKLNSNIKIFESIYRFYITSINWNYENEFIFTDINSNINILTTSKLKSKLKEANYNNEISKLLTNVTDLNINNELNNTDEINDSKLLDINSFFNLFENIENDIKLETMFEKVIQVIN